ncbi:MAG: WcaI family glycosyltransferase [Dehalococcoidia bacterium]|nr:WcaI family glycosyltransferase [Dehalococcoidia bacterium]
MRLLIFSLYYAPEEAGNAPYITGVAEHFAASGHEITVVAGMPHYPDWRVRDGYRGALQRREVRNGVTIRRRWHYVPDKQSALRRAAYEATGFAGGIGALGLKRPDAIIGVVPALSDAMLARTAAARFGAPYGLVFQDVISRGAAQSGVAGGEKVARQAAHAEGWAVRGAARVGVVAEGFRPHLMDLGAEPEAIVRLRNWTTIPPAAAPPADTRRRFGLPVDGVVCLHAGNMGHKQGLENIVECARVARGAADDRLSFVLLGDGNQRRELEKLAAAHDLPNLRFLPVQPLQELADLLQASDVLLVNQRPAVGDMSLPSKLTAYLPSGRPVVAAVAADSEAALEVTASGGGVVVAPGDSSALLNAIQRLADDGEQAQTLARRGRSYARRVLARPAALAGYDDLLARVVASRSFSVDSGAATTWQATGP